MSKLRFPWKRKGCVLYRVLSGLGRLCLWKVLGSICWVKMTLNVRGGVVRQKGQHCTVRELQPVWWGLGRGILKRTAAGEGCSEICVLKRQFSIKMENRLDESNRSLRETQRRLLYYVRREIKEGLSQAVRVRNGKEGRSWPMIYRQNLATSLETGDEGEGGV